MPVNQATAVWNGNLLEGKGQIKGATGAIEVGYSLKSRVENTAHTNPEELIAAAHAGCFSMMLSALLSEAGTPPERIETQARVTQEQVEGAFLITSIQLICEAEVPGIGESDFLDLAQNAKQNCPVSRALSGTSIRLEARLKT